eukprot:1409682-Rhodomonas_salina.3
MCKSEGFLTRHVLARVAARRCRRWQRCSAQAKPPSSFATSALSPDRDNDTGVHVPILHLTFTSD